MAKYDIDMSFEGLPPKAVATIALRAAVRVFPVLARRRDATDAGCRTIEEMKAWSQNLGHEELMTTFASYGTLSRNQQADIMGAMSST
jgi:hypothetical protein